jgi:predicted PurR-regulated permease PerM
MPLRPYIRQGAFWIMLLLVTAAFVGMLKPFLLTLFWATLLAVIFHRTFRIINWRLRGKANLAAAITTILILLIVVLPVFLLLIALVDQSMIVYKLIESGAWDPTDLVDYIEKELPNIEGMLSRAGLTPERMRADLSNFALSFTRSLADYAVQYTQNAIAFTAQFFIMLYVLFFFLRDGISIVRSVVGALPFGNRWEYVVINRFTSVARATLKGTLIVAAVQGAIGGIMFALLGIQGALFWGVVMMLLSLLPVGGSALVWAPAAVILFFQGYIGSGIALTIVGAMGIGLVDNLLRPLLVGRDTQMPDYLVLLATLGGIGWFGLSGFVLGPVLAAVFLTCWEVAGRDFGGSDA